MTFNDEQQYCQDTFSTSLATITTTQDNINAVNTLQTAGLNWAWIGLHFAQNANWEWIDGTSCSYAINNDCTNDIHWGESEPSGNANEDCVYIATSTGLYNNNPCTVSPSVLCNKPSNTNTTTNSIDLDNDGYPTSFSVKAYGSDGIYSFQDQWYDGKRVYDSLNSARQIWWSSYFNKWFISSSGNIGGGYFAECFSPIIHHCNQGIKVKYCVYAENSNGYYMYNSTENGYAVFERDTNDRYIQYASESNKWNIYDTVSINGTNPINAE
eukprot:341137_1